MTENGTSHNRVADGSPVPDVEGTLQEDLVEMLLIKGYSGDKNWMLH
ncbi:hypothetical protein [Thermoplasma sp.]|nr:hypothetical protein [Thermoplasma sp.]